MPKDKVSRPKIPRGLRLEQDEVPIWYGRMSKKCVLGSIIGFVILFFFGIIATFAIPNPIAVFIGLIMLLISFILLIRAIIRVWSTEYFISNHRVYVKYGIGGRNIYEVRHDWVSNYVINQSLGNRILNVGKLVISTPGHYKGYVEMNCVSSPIRVKELLENVLQKYRRVVELRNKLARLEEEFEFGRIDSARYNELKAKYLEEIDRIWQERG